MTARLVHRLRRDLSDAGDADRAVQQQRYMRSSIPFHGVAMPRVRQIVGAALREHPVRDQDDLTTTVRTLWDEVTHREQWYAALAVLRSPGHRRWRDPSFLPLYDHLVVTGRWWDVVDDVATHCLRELLTLEPTTSGEMRRWAGDDDLWRRRAALVCQVGARDDSDTDLLRDVVESNLAGTDFFLRKGVGWALRDYARTDPDWVRRFVATHRDAMSGLSLREATKHL